MDQQEEKEVAEQGFTSKFLLKGMVLFAAIIIIGLIFMPKPKKTYQITEEEMLAQLIAKEGIITPEKIVDLIYQPDSSYQFIDLRSAPEYLKGHLPKAINIPVDRLFDKENEEILKQTDKINVLYSSDHSAACGPWMILNQLGYHNNKIMLGGYSYVNEFIIDKYAPMSGNFRDEKAKFDYSKIIGETSGINVNATNTENEKPANAPVVKKKKEGKSSGGC
jgi:rhodanese-related sulfurtransferase